MDVEGRTTRYVDRIGFRFLPDMLCFDNTLLAWLLKTDLLVTTNEDLARRPQIWAVEFFDLSTKTIVDAHAYLIDSGIVYNRGLSLPPQSNTYPEYTFVDLQRDGEDVTDNHLRAAKRAICDPSQRTYQWIHSIGECFPNLDKERVQILLDIGINFPRE